MDDSVLFENMDRFNSLMSGKGKGDIPDAPDREFIARVYKFIRSRDKWRYDNEILCKRLGLSASDYAKICIAVTALTELGTLVRDEEGNLMLPQENVKVNLSNAPVLKRISEHKG